MLRKLHGKKKGQNTAEYAILISLVVGAVIAMQTYVQRGLQAKMRDAVVDYLVNQTSALGLGNSVQYEPYYMERNFLVTRISDESITLGNGTSGMSGSVNTTRSQGNETIDWQFDFRTNTQL